MNRSDRGGRVRLGSSTIDRLPDAIVRPTYARESLEPGILHLGVGAFHRCHQAEWTDDALQADFGRWGIVGVNLRPPDLRTMLEDQNGYFCRITRRNGVDDVRLVGSILRTVSVLGTDYDPHRLTLAKALEWAADPRIRVITMTVTEKGYCHTPATGELDEGHPDILHDRNAPDAPASVPGFLVRALEMRRARGVPMPVMVSCDNVPDNGATLRRCVLGLARMTDGALADAIERDARFPNTMVDRIVPATLDEDVERFAAATGVEDYGLVVGEPFRMWVIERPAGVELPSWDKAGALFVDDVAPFELLKMRVLNGIQSNVCQLGALSGLPFMADVMALPEFRTFATNVMLDEVVPCLEDVPGLDLREYVAQSIARLTNPDLKHRTAQISTDGSRKIKPRLLEPIRSALAAGTGCDGLLLGVAGWMQHATGMDHRGQAVELHDPIAERTREIGQRAGNDAAAIVGQMLSLQDVFGTDLRHRRVVVDRLVGFLAQLLEKPAREVVRDFAAARAR